MNRLTARSALILAAIGVAILVWAPVESSRAAAPKPLSAYDRQAKELLARMTLDEKIGQMTEAEQDALHDISDINTLALGSLLSGGSSDPKTNSLADWTDMYDRYQKQALKSRLGIPILYGVDAVHGHNNVLGAVIFPHNIGLGATRDPALVEKVERTTALEVRATGIQWVFAPCVAVPRDERWGRTYEGFGESPQLVAEMAEAAVRGFQGLDLSDPTRVLACAKHFVGDGGTTGGKDQGDTRLSEKELREIHMQGYIAAIRAGVGTIMPSYSSWNGQKVSGSKRLLTEILKHELGFQGFLISDYDAIDQLPGDYPSDIEQSINAGMDMVMVPKKYREFIADLKKLVESGKVSMARIDDAVTRILRVKIAMGLMDKSRSQLADRSLQTTFGSAEHRAVARQAVRESMVVLKNDNHVLPLARNAKRIHVAGKNADDIGNQCGGWTIDWQGRSGPVTPGGTTILDAIRQSAGKQTRVTFSKDGTGAEGADVAVVVVGETPYAEGKGDRADLALAPEDVAAVEAANRAKVPVVLVVISGRPLILEKVLNKVSAIVAAWLPGTEGEGVADVLFGDYKPTGKLPVSWPRSMNQIPINVGDSNYNPLFAYGYGLSY